MTFDEPTNIFTINAHGSAEKLHEFSIAIGKTPRIEVTKSNIVSDEKTDLLVLKYKSNKEHGIDYFEHLAKEMGVSISNFEKKTS